MSKLEDYCCRLISQRQHEHHHQQQQPCARNSNSKRLLTIADIHDIAYWSQWRLAIHGVCARFEATAQIEANCWSRERLGRVSNSKKQQTIEDRHLEAALRGNAEALAKTESARAAAATTVRRLQAQISHQGSNSNNKEIASASVRVRELEDKISRSTTARQGLEESLQRVQAAKCQVEAKVEELLRESTTVQEELSKARLAMDRVLKESQAEKERSEALHADLAALREKYSALKRRFVDAGKKVEAVRGERDALRQERATLQDKLADVEKFQRSTRGQALDRMEQDLASERMRRVELEADRDDLQSQLAAARQATARS